MYKFGKEGVTMYRTIEKNNLQFNNTTIFHVHTHRCGHASSEPDVDYIEKAIKLGATQIVFTDHCPFPKNPFPWRMDYEQLPEYVFSLKHLREKYQDKISIKIGLEAEYFPSYDWYYKELLESKDFDILILGQHIYEHADGSFGYADVDKESEIRGFVSATLQGIRSGYFQVAAHPDRPLDRINRWNKNADEIAKEIAKAAKETGVILEKNITSMKNGYQYKPEFWENIPADVNKIYGLDAHCVKDMESYYQMACKLNQEK